MTYTIGAGYSFQHGAPRIRGYQRIHRLGIRNELVEDMEKEFQDWDPVYVFALVFGVTSFLLIVHIA